MSLLKKQLTNVDATKQPPNVGSRAVSSRGVPTGVIVGDSPRNGTHEDIRSISFLRRVMSIDLRASSTEIKTRLGYGTNCQGQRRWRRLYVLFFFSLIMR